MRLAAVSPDVLPAAAVSPSWALRILQRQRSEDKLGKLKHFNICELSSPTTTHPRNVFLF